MKNETETIPGFLKTVVARKNFIHNGRRISAGEEFQTDADDAIELAGARFVEPPIGGGAFTLQPMSDGFHKITPWGTHIGAIEHQPWLRCEFLQDVPGMRVKAGDRRRLRYPIATELPHYYVGHEWQNTPTATRGTPFNPVIVIHERRPRRMSDDEIAERQEAVAAGMRNENSWMSATYKQ
jgi:hypothetical protein